MAAAQRTKPRWVTDPRALFTLLSIRGLSAGDVVSFRSAEDLGKTKRPTDVVQSRRYLSVEVIRQDDIEYICEVYANEGLMRADHKDMGVWWLIGWRKPTPKEKR